MAEASRIVALYQESEDGTLVEMQSFSVTAEDEVGIFPTEGGYIAVVRWRPNRQREGLRKHSE
jgi:hypothetical protein